ncbi:MAG: hypothetical protein ABI723_16285 [Bacteroidia bacterium]
MALNPTHSFEDLGDVKCGIVEKNCSDERVAFLKQLLEFNKYTVVVVPSPPPKAAAKPAATVEGEATPAIEAPVAPATFTVGVTDVSFSPINAVFNRELKIPSGQIVTKDYWFQRETSIKTEEWYWKSI